MRVKSTWLYLSAMVLLLLGLMWAVPAGAAPSPVVGTIASDRDFVSPSLDLNGDGTIDDTADKALRTVTVTVTDPDLNIIAYVGDGPGGETPDFDQVDNALSNQGQLAPVAGGTAGDGELITVPSSCGATGCTFTVALAANPINDVDTTGVTPAQGGGDANLIGQDLFTPLTDRNGNGSITESDVEFVFIPGSLVQAGDLNVSIFNVDRGLLSFSANSGDNANAKFNIRYSTASTDFTVATIRNPEDSTHDIQLVLRENAPDTGEFEGSFVVAEDVLVDVGAVEGEQHFITGGPAAKSATESITVDVTGVATAVTLPNSPIRDADGDGDIDADDFTFSGGPTFVTLIDADEGTITVDDSASGAESTYTIGYLGSRQESFTLRHLPVQGAGVTAVVVPLNQSATLVQINAEPAVGDAAGRLRLGIRSNVASEGTWVAVSYMGSKRFEVGAGAVDPTCGVGNPNDATTPATGANPNGDDDCATVDEGETFTIGEIDPPIADTNRNGVFGDETVVVIGHDIVSVISETSISITVRGAGVHVGAADTVDLQYSISTLSDQRNAFDPTNAFRPIIRVNDGPFDIVYADIGDGATARVTPAVVAEATLPVVGDPSPSSGSATSSLTETLLNTVSDAVSLIDAASVEILIAVAPKENPVPELDDNTVTTFDADTITTSSAEGAVTASVGLSDEIGDTGVTVAGSLGITGEPEQTLAWWVRATDTAGNSTTSDADPDTVGVFDPFVLNMDKVAPKIDDGAVTGDNWNADPAAVDDPGTEFDDRLLGDRRFRAPATFLNCCADPNSLRIDFDDALDGSTVDITKIHVAGNTVVDILHFAGMPDNLFVVLQEATLPGGTPAIVLEDGFVFDGAGNGSPAAILTAGDGIAPTATVDIQPSASDARSTGQISITITTDENIRTPNSGPVVTISALDPGDPDVTDGVPTEDVAAGTAAKTSGTNQWTYNVDIAASNTYSVFVEVDDSRRNRSTTGDNPGDGDIDVTTAAHTFEIDSIFNGGVAAVTEPLEGAAASDADIFIMTLNFLDEAGEYPADTSGTVELTKAELDGVDILDSQDTRDNISFTLAKAGIGLGPHALVYNAKDALGNLLVVDADATLNFTVEQRPTFDLTLSLGLNLVSLPSDPVDGDTNAIFGSNQDVDLIFTFDKGIALIASRSDTTTPFDIDPANPQSLTAIDSAHAYFVRAKRKTIVPVDIADLGASIPPLLEIAGGDWALVPIISLERLDDIPQGTLISAADYLGDFRAAFSFERDRLVPLPRVDITPGVVGAGGDGVNNPISVVEVGSGVWVLYSPGVTEILVPAVLPLPLP